MGPKLPLKAIDSTVKNLIQQEDTQYGYADYTQLGCAVRYKLRFQCNGSYSYVLS